jgi:hypothetical protein
MIGVRLLVLMDLLVLGWLFSVDLSQKAPMPQVCVLIPATSRGQGWTAANESYILRYALPSLARTCEPHGFRYSVYVGYDAGDALFDRPQTLSAMSERAREVLPHARWIARPFRNDLRKPGPVKNFLSREAYDDGCDFMYSITDDTELLTPWTSRFVGALRGFAPPLRGVVGPACSEGNARVITHDFVHRSHLDAFQTHYPAELTDWWLDDWITWVYGEGNARRLSDVLVQRHHAQQPRYNVSWESSKALEQLVGPCWQTPELCAS